MKDVSVFEAPNSCLRFYCLSFCSQFWLLVCKREMNKLSICEYFVWENHIILHLYIGKVKLSLMLSFTNGYGQLLSKPGNKSKWKCSMAIRSFKNIFGHQKNCFWHQETLISKPTLISLTSWSLLVNYLSGLPGKWPINLTSTNTAITYATLMQ